MTTWTMKCNHCQTHFQYGETDTWLDKGGPVHCLEHRDRGYDEEAYFRWLADFAPIHGEHLSPGEVTRERAERHMKAFERRKNLAYKNA